MSNLSINLTDSESFSSGLYEDTLNVSEFRCSAGRKSYRVFRFERIETKGLTKDILIKRYKEKGYKELPDITELPTSIIIQYKNKPPIVIDRKTGKIYIPNNYPRKLVSNQLEKVIRVLQKEKRVVGFTCTTYHRQRTIPFEEGETIE